MLVLVAIDLAGASNQGTAWLSDGIWIVFIADFGLKLLLAPRNVQFLRRNWLTHQ